MENDVHTEKAVGVNKPNTTMQSVEGMPSSSSSHDDKQNAIDTVKQVSIEQTPCSGANGG